MTQWANVLATGGAAAAGGALTGFSAIWAQVVTHRGTSKREREARREESLRKHLNLEQDTLLALQDALEEVSSLVARIRVGLIGDPMELATEAHGKIGRAMKLANRTRAIDAAKAAIWYCRLVYEAMGLDLGLVLDTNFLIEKSRAVEQAWTDAMWLTGEALRAPYSQIDDLEPPGWVKA
ncbi:hypothetical protein [Actinoallomurus sp. CA-142502]|uniref:hypothetical protein n=1 Tax=Actinoallomurus sp. CA-142502 TaxID=3239885 RepID=UPI003D9421A1